MGEKQQKSFLSPHSMFSYFTRKGVAGDFHKPTEILARVIRAGFFCFVPSPKLKLKSATKAVKLAQIK